MRTVLALLLLALPLAPAQAAAPAPSALVLDGVRVAAGPATTQVVTVNHTAGHRARVTYWRLVAGEWVARMRTDDGRTGYGGLVAGDRRVQGTGTTPLGTYGLLSVFGTHPRATRGRSTTAASAAATTGSRTTRRRTTTATATSAQGGFRWWLPSSRPERVRAADRLPPARTSGRSSPASTSSRCGTAGRGSSCTSTAAARRPAACPRRAASCARSYAASTRPPRR